MIEKNKNSVSRRRLLKLGIIAAVSGIIPFDSMAAVNEFLSKDRKVMIYNLHTKEYLDLVYWKNGEYIPEAFEKINFIFRDHYNGSVKSIDGDLIDLLCAIHHKLNSKEPFHLISGYRTKKTNRLLRKRNNRVAKGSLHIYGKAADIRLPDQKLKILRRAAYELKQGGVGFYPRSNFIHVDVGNVRFWRG